MQASRRHLENHDFGHGAMHVKHLHRHYFATVSVAIVLRKHNTSIEVLLVGQQ